tara:strand:- start:274 stop:2490 length:2217 start_codon:yes stop_codon:yes gene_type:complete
MRTGSSAYADALATLDSVLTSFVESEADEARRKEDFATKLYLSEVERINAYKDTLASAGVALPSEFQTEGFSDLVDIAGNDITLASLRELQRSAMTQTNELRSLWAGYNQGKALAPSYVGVRDDSGRSLSYTEGESPSDAVRFSPSEFDAFSSNIEGFAGLDEYGQQAFKQGFLSANMDPTKALDYLNAQNANYASNMELQRGRFDEAELFNSKFLDHTGKHVEEILEGAGIPFTGIFSLYAQEDSADRLMEELERLRDGRDYNLSKNSLVGRKIADAIAEHGAFKVDQGGYRSESLVELAGFAKEVENNLDAILRSKGSSINQLQRMQRVNPKKYKKIIDAMSKESETFAGLVTVMEDLKKVKLWRQNVTNDAIKGLNVHESIQDERYNYALKMVEEMQGEGLEVNFEMPERGNYDITGKVNYNPDDIHSAYLESLIDDDAGYYIDKDYIGISSIVGEAFESELETLATESASIKKTKEEISTLKYNIRLGIDKYGGQGTWRTWMDDENPFRFSGLSGIPYHGDYVPTDTEVDKMVSMSLNRIKRRLDPEVNNTWVEKIPILGLFAKFFPQGAEGVLEEYPDVVKDLEALNQWVSDINTVRELEGKTKIRSKELEDAVKELGLGFNSDAQADALKSLEQNFVSENLKKEREEKFKTNPGLGVIHNYIRSEGLHESSGFSQDEIGDIALNIINLAGLDIESSVDLNMAITQAIKQLEKDRGRKGGDANLNIYEAEILD